MTEKSPKTAELMMALSHQIAGQAMASIALVSLLKEKGLATDQDFINHRDLIATMMMKGMDNKDTAKKMIKEMDSIFGTGFQLKEKYNTNEEGSDG